MDADILRQQIRKSLRSTKRIENVDLDDDNHGDSEDHGVPSYLMKQNSDDDVGEVEDEDEEPMSPLSPLSSDLSSADGGSPSFGKQSNLDTAIGKRKDEDLLDSSSSSSSGGDNDDDDDDDDYDRKRKGKREEQQDDADDGGGGAGEDDGRFHFSSDDEDDDEDDADDGKGVSHSLVLDAWSKQIEQSMNKLKSQGGGHDDSWETGGGGVEVKYIQKQALSPSLSGSNDRLNYSSSSLSPGAIDLEPPGASSREDLENLGRIFLRVKLEACLWLERTLKTPLFAGKDRLETSTLYEVLKDGVVLCEIANAIIPNCIPSFTRDFSESNFMVPLSERENIKRFIKACKDSMSIPDTLLFQVGDLHNMQNMPKVVLSLRAVAEYARLHLGSPVSVHWPNPQEVEFDYDSAEDLMLMAQAEMSKFDSKTVHHMYAVENSAPPPGPGRFSKPDIDKAGFEARKRSIQQNLAMNLAAGGGTNSATSSFKSASGGVSPPLPPPSPQNITSNSRTTPQSSLGQTEGDDFGGLTDAVAYSVEAWLHSLGMGSYYQNFLEEGWDEMETVVLMTEADLADCGISKKGHKRKLMNSIKRLRTQHSLFPDALDDDADGNGGTPRSGLHRRRLSAEHRREIFNKDLSWSKCRGSHNVTLDLDDAKAIWAMLKELRHKVYGNGEEGSTYLKNCAMDISRSVGYLLGITEDLVRSLIPFDAPIIIDIGWNTVKVGFAFTSNPMMVPTIAGMYSVQGKLVQGSPQQQQQQQIRSGKTTYSFGKHVIEQCHAAMSGQTSSSTTGGYMVRHSIHRGIDSIKDPVLYEWDDLEQLLEHIYKDLLHAFPDRHPVFVVEPVKGWGPTERNKLASILIDKFHVPAFYLTPAAPMVSHQSSLKSCVVVDLGDSRSTASVVYNNRLVKDAVVNSPIGGLQMTELMMQNLTQDGYEFKSIFEAKNPSKFASLRHFMEQEIAKEVKERVCICAQNYEEKVVNKETLPPHLIDYFPRVTRGTPYINIGEARIKVSEALFAPDIIRRDQFYNGGSLQHIIKEALSRCTEVVNNAACETVLLCGGVANLPGLAGRLQKELNDLYSLESRKPPRVVLVTEEESCHDCAHAAWQGAAKVVMEHDFQTRWISHENYKEKGTKAIQDSSISEGLGPFPLHSPDTTLYKANRAVTSLTSIIDLLHQQQLGLSSQQQSPTLQERRGDNEDKGKREKFLKIEIPTSSTGMGRGQRGDGANSPMSPLSPRSLQDLVQQVCLFLQERGCPEKSIIDVKMYLYEQYSTKPPQRGLSALDTIQTLPDRLLATLTPYIHGNKAKKGSQQQEKSKQSTIPSKQQQQQKDEEEIEEFEDEEEDDDDDDDDDDESGVWAMAI